MFFDRYEIHIQAFVDLINGRFIIFKSSSSENIIQKEVKQKNTVHRTFKTSQKIDFVESRIYKDNMFQDVPIFFLYSLKHFVNS